MLKLKKGSVRDLTKYYTLFEIDFDERELIGRLALQKALINGNAEFYIAYDTDSRIDLAYALVFGKNVYGYALIKYFGVFPWYRGRGIGKDAMRLLIAQLADKNGIIAEIPVFEENDEAQIKKLTNFFSRFGFEPCPCNYRIGGAETKVLCKPIKSSNAAGIMHRIIPDFYSRITPSKQTDIKAPG